MLVALDVPADVEVQVGDPAPAVSRDGDRTVVWLEGEHDIATAPVLADTLAKVTSAGAADLIVDLSGLTFLSATTIGVLIQGRNSLRRQSRNLCLRSPSRCARRVLDACGLAGLLEPGPMAAQEGQRGLTETPESVASRSCSPESDPTYEMREKAAIARHPTILLEGPVRRDELSSERAG